MTWQEVAVVIRDLAIITVFVVVIALELATGSLMRQARGSQDPALPPKRTTGVKTRELPTSKTDAQQVR